MATAIDFDLTAENGTKARPRKAATSFKVCCPECGVSGEDGTVRLDLNNLKALTCSNCDAEFTAAEAVAKMAENLRRWQAVEKWLNLAGECLAD